MAEKNVRVPEFLREPLEAAQARLEAFEGETRRAVEGLIHRSREGRKEITELVHRLSRQEWGVEELRTRIGKIGEQGLEMAVGLRDRARAEALERLEDLQGKAIAFLGVASRDQVEDLSRELARLSKRLEKGRRARRPARRPAAEV